MDNSSTGETGSKPTRPADVPRGTLSQLFFTGADEWDKSDAFLAFREGEWQAVSHRSLLETVRFVSAGLRQLGVTRGDRVALLSENRSEWAIADFAILCAGALNVPIYPTLPAGQVAEILEHAGTVVAFVSTREQLEKLLTTRATTGLGTIIAFDDVADGAADVIAMGRLIEMGREVDPGENDFRRQALAADPDDVATIIYTSGTTGTPKGVMLTHDNLYSNVRAGLAEFDIGAADIALSFLPLSHVLQRMVDYAMYDRGCTIAHLPSIDDLGAALGSVRPSVAVAVPRIFEKLYARILSVKGFKRRIVLWSRAVALSWAEHSFSGKPAPLAARVARSVADRLVYSKIRTLLGGRMRIFISGGAPLGPQIARFFWSAGVPIYEGYGLTETSPVTNVNTPSHTRIGTVGRATRGTEIRIAEDGEILVRGPQIMKGYYRNPDGTAAAVEPDGWFHTGDIGELDEEGYLRITDRKKDLLVTAGGKNITPQPIQNAAKQSRFIAEAVLLGDRRPYPIMLVVPNFDSLEDWARHKGLSWTDNFSLLGHAAVRDKLQREVARRVSGFARYEQPKKVLALPRELTLENDEVTPKLSVKRRVVEAHFWEEIEALYADQGTGRE